MTANESWVDEVKAVARGEFALLLPQRSLRAIQAEDRAERRQQRETERLRAVRAEESHNKALLAYQQAAAERGEDVSVADVLAGNAGRSIADVFADALAMADAQDARARAREQHVAGAREVLPYPVSPPARALGEEPERAPAQRSSAARMELSNKLRHFSDRIEARRRADELDAAWQPPRAVRSASVPRSAVRSGDGRAACPAHEDASLACYRCHYADGCRCGGR